MPGGVLLMVKRDARATIAKCIARTGSPPIAFPMLMLGKGVCLGEGGLGPDEPVQGEDDEFNNFR